MTYATIARSDWATSKQHESWQHTHNLIGPRAGTVHVVSFSSRTEIKLWEGVRGHMESCCGNTNVHMAKSLSNLDDYSMMTPLSEFIISHRGLNAFLRSWCFVVCKV